MTFDDDFDPARLAEDAVRANLDPRCFEQIDDRDILRPTNLFEWMRGADFLAIKPFPKQVEIGTNMLGEFCPRCTDPLLQRRDDHFGNKLLEIPVDLSLAEVQEFVGFLSDGQCRRCGVTRPELLDDGVLRHYLNLNGVAGMRASKSVTVGGLLATYQLARFLMLPNPSRFFGLMDNQMLHGTFVAITAGQAYDTLWQAFKDRLDSSPWFRTYHEFLKSEGHRLGRELFDVKDTFVWYGHKQLSFSFCGPDIRTIRGRTRFFTSIDELGWFDVQADSGGGARIRMNAVEAHEALIKSLRTVRSASRRLRGQGVVAPDGLNCDVSSPSSINDAIMRGLRDANSDPTIFAFHYATWEMNPDVPLDSLRDEMRNKLAFERDYGAVPPLGANQFIDAQNAVEKCCTDVPQRRFATWTREQHTDEYGESSVYLRVTPSARDQTCPRILTVDTGLSNNSFAVSVWHYDRESRNPVCDIALECAPDRQKGAQIPVNFPLMFEHAILPLVQNYRIIMAVYDRWSSIEMVQRLRQEHRVESYQYSLRWADFLTVRARVLDSSLRLPHPEMTIEDVRRSTLPFDQLVRAIPVTHLVLQTLTVREVGRKVIKPLNGTDDLFRCLCLAVKFMLDPAHTKKFERYSSSLHEQHQAVGVVRSNRAPTHRSGVTVGARRSFTPRG